MTQTPRDPMHYLPGPNEARQLSTEELRDRFLVRGLFQPGRIVLRHIDLDRVVLGGAVPIDSALPLEAPESIASAFFTERRELGVLNIGGAGSVTVDGKSYALDARDALYVGRGSRDVVFASADRVKPARFYLVSYPAHTDHPTTFIHGSEAPGAEIGGAERANQRTVRRYIHLEGPRSAQLVMGVTTLASGSVWNTMPSHTHHRRTEVYLYFDLPADAVVVHLMGEPDETRHLIVRDGEAVLSPGWSIHSGCGTAPYSFCWAMGGENQVYNDMQPVNTGDML